MVLPIEKLAGEGLLCSQLLSIKGLLVFEPGVRMYGRVTVENCQIGASSYINADSRVVRARVGRYCSIGSQVNIGLLKHPTDWVTTSSFTYDHPGVPPQWRAVASSASFACYPDLTTIEDDVWIGFGVIIAASKPILIGRGSVIAAGSVVTKDVPPYSIVGGNPARHIRYRFPERLIDQLQASEWWCFDHARFAEANPGISVPYSDPEAFLQWWEQEGVSLMEDYRFPGVFKQIRMA